MNWTKAIGFGVLIWLIMFAVVSVISDWYQGNTWVKIVVILLAGAIAFFLAGYVKPSSAGLAIGYGLVWVVVGLALDYLITKRFNSEIFSLWSVWTGYALILLAPLLKVEEGA